jgi:hypothetical protein
MKNKIINEDNLKIKKLVNKILKEHISNSQIMTEQSIVPRILNKLLGSRIVQKLESSKGDDVIRELESLFVKGERNLGMEAGQVAFKSATGSNIKMSQIQNGIELVLDGSHTPDEVAGMFPRNLVDGTDFRSQLLSLLKKQKPKTSTASTPWKNRLNNILNSKKTVTGSGRYFPTNEDFLDVQNLVIAANPGMSGSKVSKVVDETKRIVSAKTQDEFIVLADGIITKMSSNFDKPKKFIGAKLWRLIRENPRTALLASVIFAPTITAALSNKALDQFNTFLREFSPKFGDILDTIGVSDPRTNSNKTNPDKPVFKFKE